MIECWLILKDHWCCFVQYFPIIELNDNSAFSRLKGTQLHVIEKTTNFKFHFRANYQKFRKIQIFQIYERHWFYPSKFSQFSRLTIERFVALIFVDWSSFYTDSDARRSSSKWYTVYHFLPRAFWYEEKDKWLKYSAGKHSKEPIISFLIKPQKPNKNLKLFGNNKINRLCLEALTG